MTNWRAGCERHYYIRNSLPFERAIYFWHGYGGMGGDKLHSGGIGEVLERAVFDTYTPGKEED